MFFGALNMQLQDDGALFQKYCKYHILASKILELKGKTCTVYFDKEHTEIIFSFHEEDFNDDETYVKLSSFITEGDYKKLRRQFYIPRDYLKYYPDKTVRIIGLDNAFCVSSTVSEESEMSSEEFEKLIAEIENLNDGN